MTHKSASAVSFKDLDLSNLLTFPSRKSASDATLQPQLPVVSPEGEEEGGKEGKGGKGGSIALGTPPLTSFQLTNAEFLGAVFVDLPAGARTLITAKAGDPTTGGWSPSDGAEVESICTAGLNTYFNCASFMPGEDGALAARKDSAAGYHALMLDDVGTKVDRALLGSVTPTWDLETSPGNYQVGFRLDPPLRDAADVDRFQKAIAAAGLTDKGALGMARWGRLPTGINGKAKYKSGGKPFYCRLTAWNPGTAYSAQDLLTMLAPGSSVQNAKVSAIGPIRSRRPRTAIDPRVYSLPVDENAVLATFKQRGLHKGILGPGKHDVTCPRVHEHTDQLDTGTAYFEPNGDYPAGGFRCQHSHGEEYRLGQVLDDLGVTIGEARNRPAIRTMPGEMKPIFDACEDVLSGEDNIYQSGGLIVRAGFDAMMGDWAIKPLSEQELTLALAHACDWYRPDQKRGDWVRCDPPQRHVSMIFKASRYDRLPLLKGLARQPYFRAEDGELVIKAGYDPVSKKLGIFDPAAFPEIGNSLAEAQAGLAAIRELISEFHFATPADEATALAAIMTAAVRQSIELAPAFHVQASAPGSGKSYLCEVIGSFAGAGLPMRISYPKTSEEATKAIIAGLMAAPAVIEFDDMDTDWLPFGSIKSMLTATSITGRILGYSKMATVSTNALILGSGNNVGPIRDLCRRVATIRLHVRSATPGTTAYKGNPVAMLKRERERFVVAVLTIVEAWKAAGSPKAASTSLASYGGAWSDYCRHPLVWLGLPDPATSIFEQMRADPDAEPMEALLIAWDAKHGDKPITIRKLVVDGFGDDLQDALMDLPVVERQQVNRSKLGWYLKRNMNRIFGGLMLEKAESSERNAWRVVRVGDDLPPSPPLPTPI
jgi:hypothetical protein